MAVAVRIIKIFGTKDNRSSTLADVTKNECFLSSIRFCCQSFDIVNNSPVIQVYAGVYMKITFGPIYQTSGSKIELFEF